MLLVYLIALVVMLPFLLPVMIYEAAKRALRTARNARRDRAGRKC